jgi:sec-independent protein translocase protein TatA
MFGLGVPELLVVMAIGLLLFGKNLPTLARSLGKSFVEFQRGVRGLEDEIHSGPVAVRHEPAADQIRAPQRVAATAPKFEDAPAVPGPR